MPGNPFVWHGPGPMPRVFDEMMDSLARNPAGGFQDFLARQEGHATRGVTLSAAEERRIGRKQREQYLRAAKEKGYDVVDDPEKLRYLRSLVETFARRMGHRDRYRDIDVTLISAPIPDGQSFPGGSLVFTTALLDEPDEATVAGVVAHELAHLDRGHIFEYARRAKLAETGFRAPGPGADFDRLMTHNMALGSLMMNPFRPEHELQADCTATTWLYEEGYDPRALVRFFDRLHERSRDQPDQPFFRFARSHPYSLDRGSEVLDRLGQLRQWKNRDDLGLYADNLRRLKSRRQESQEQDAPARAGAGGEPRRRDDRPDAGR